MTQDSDFDMDVSDYAGSDDDFTAGSSSKPAAKKAKTTAKKATTTKKAANAAPRPRAKPGPKGKKDATQNGDHDDEAPERSNTPLGASTSTNNGTDGRAIEDIYQKKTQLEHILLRPDTYIGAIETIQQQLWVFDSTTNTMVQRNLSIVPGFYKIVDEILVNAADNKIRDPNMDTIKVTISREDNEISVYNNGHGIPIEMHKEEKVYVPELIFGHLLTSSNYNDDQKKVTGGRNGYGAKLCNIFSTQFIVETADKVNKYKQQFNNNMSQIGKPRISANPRKEEYTKITFKPDLAKFGMEAIDDDIEALLKKRVYDMAGTVADVKVFLNGERIKIKNFKQYVELYTNTGNAETKPTIIHQIVNQRWEVAFTVSDGQFQQVSFVNGISTAKGGTHVNYVADQIVNKLVDAVKKKNKAAPVKPFQVKSHMWVFVNCLIENPAFDSQTKENMTLRASAFGSKCDMPEDFIKKIMKSGVVENVLSWAKFKQDQQLKKTDGHKRSRISGIVKLEDANNAGSRNGHRCTLILTEGDSAKALAVSGLSVIGRDNFGVFPLRGKLLNVRDAAHTQIMNNVEINQVNKFLVYNTEKHQDHDGSHIKGLIINFFDHFFPSLLRLPGFLIEFITPIVKATRGKREMSFFTIPEYESWKEENDNGKGWTIKYYKGLGTSTSLDAKKYFSNMNIHRKPFKVMDEEERPLIDMAFNKKKADDRKEWLRNFKPGTYMDHNVEEIPIADFINKELVLFSMADNARSIPSMMDGLKPGQRKVLYACFKRKLKNEIKVAQLIGYVSENTAYHHGEQSLTSTIIGMAQNFVGSNNCNLLAPIGQFGTRLQGGKDAASARYIYTSLQNIARTLFHAADDQLLNYLNDDGQMIEPEWYIPVLPLVLVNGSEGIGTGWSSYVPNYNPKDIVDNLFRMMDGQEMEPMHPWYHGFEGTIERVEDKYKVTGKIEKIDDNTLEITELPIRTWTQSYKEQLESWLTGTDKSPAFIKDYKEYHTDTKVHFIIKLTDENMRKAEAEGLEKRFKIFTPISTTNMVCFDSENRIKRYNSPEEILQEFYNIRLVYYQRRKEWLTNQLTNEWTKLDNRVRFILEIIQGKLIVQNRKRNVILDDLRKRGYTAFPKHVEAKMAGTTDAGNSDNDDDDDNNSGSGKDHGYDYLLSMAIWTLTEEKVEKLKKDLAEKQRELDLLLKKDTKAIWREDLDGFLAEWESFIGSYASDNKQTVKPKAWNKGKRSARKDSDDDDDYAAKQVKRKPAAPRKKEATATATTSATSSTAKLQQTLTDTFKPVAVEKTANKTASVIQEVDENSLSLNERLDRLLAKKKQEAAAAGPSTSVAKPVKKSINKPKSKTPVQEAITTLSASDSDASPLPVARRAARQTRKIQAYMEIDDDDDDDVDTANTTIQSAVTDDVFMASDNDSEF
ncbi:DNA topoisomerase [Syncephalis fuscata]|nr:DNA topoisomerase [Syncephalis fuscata]